MSQRSVVPLFRRQALEFQQSQRQWGEVVLLQPVSTKMLSWSLVATVALLLGFLSVAPFARKATANGYLTPAAGTAKVFAPQPGVIKTVYVAEGQEVQEGQPLLQVTANHVADGNEDSDAAVLNILTAQREALSRQITAEAERGSSERERLMATLRGLVAEGVHLNEQVAMQAQRIRITESLVSSAGQLATRGDVSGVEYKRRQEALLDDKQKLAVLNEQAASLDQRLNEARYALEQLATVLATKLQPLRGELASVQQRIAEINGRRAYVIRAPIAGRIALVQATVGQTADPRRLQVEIIPAHSTLRALLFVPARTAGLVHVGQAVRLLYDAFPYEKYGTYGGRVTDVSQTILTAADTAAPVPLTEPSYKVMVALDRPSVQINDQVIPLRPDLLVRAHIVLEKRSLMDWLLQPLLRVRF